MRLVSVTLSATLSAVLLSGCSFIGGQPSGYTNPYAKQKSANHGQYGQQSAAQHCQIASPRMPIPRGCRPEQVTIGTGGYGAQGGFPQQPQYGAPGGFPQQPSFGQPQYTDGAYGQAVGRNPAMAHHTTGPKKRKPKLRGSLSLGAEKSIDGNLIDRDLRGIVGLDGTYDPQNYNQGFVTGTAAAGSVTTTRFTANSLAAGNILRGDENTPGDPDAIFRDNGDGGVDGIDARDISFTNAWSTPINIKGGLEHIINNNFTTFANVGYTYAEGETIDAVSVDGTLYRQTREQPYDATPDPVGDPIINTTFIPSQNIATFSYDVSALEKFDLELGGRYYFNPLVRSDGFRAVTPFVGASVGASRVNAVDVNVTHTQASYQQAFEGTEGATYEVPNAGSTRLYDAQWLPQGQLNIGAEWQVTPGFALAAETGLKVEGSRDYADFTNADGDIVTDASGDTNFTIPLTLRGSVNF